MIIYVHIIVFEGTGKIFPFNSILDFAILSDFKMMTVIIFEVGWEGAPRLVFSQLKVWPLLAPTPLSNILSLDPPPPPRHKYLKPSYTYVLYLVFLYV